MAMSDFYKYKGNFYNVRNILFDEFIEDFDDENMEE